MLRRRGAVLAALLLLAGACGGGGSDEEGQEQEQAAEASQAAESSRAAPDTGEVPEQPAVVRESEDSPFGFYTIQMSSWQSRSKAESEAERYHRIGLEAYVQQADLGEEGTWYRVRVGRYPALSEAREAARSLTGIDPDRTWVDNYRERGSPPPP
ncbi:MAG: SPOR domain-containing protein [bacterium]